MEIDDSIESVRKASVDSFLRAYAIREALSLVVVPNEDDETSTGIELSKPHPFHPFPAVGQIRLLSQTPDITYVLVARRWNERAFLVIPFSSYSDPATDFELKTIFDGGNFLQVLQVWNARTLQIESLQKSWLVGKLNDRDFQDAGALWRHFVGGEMPSADVLARTGLPIRDVNDVRLAYQDKVLANFAELDEADEALSNDVPRMTSEEWQKMVARRIAERKLSSVWRHPVVRREGAFAVAAAEKNEPEFFRAECDVEGTDKIVRLAYDKAVAQASLQVFDAQGNDSTSLDGWKLVDGAGNLLGEVRDGAVTANGLAEFDGVCCLVDPQGEIHALIERVGDR